MSFDPRATPILRTFDLHAENLGVCLGPGAWRGSGASIASINPANGMPLARVATATAEDIGAAIEAATRAASAWQTVPAPRRGEAVRQFGELLRAHKDALGTLVTLE